jgi:hypothetical protein
VPNFAVAACPFIKLFNAAFCGLLPFIELTCIGGKAFVKELVDI